MEITGPQALSLPSTFFRINSGNFYKVRSQVRMNCTDNYKTPLTDNEKGREEMLLLPSQHTASRPLLLL